MAKVHDGFKPNAPRTTSAQLKIANPQHSAHSKLQGWSYAVLVHPMGGSHHHIGGSVGSHLPEIQQHAQSWRSVHVCGRPWAPVSKHIMSRYGVLPWLWPPSKAWLVELMIGLSRHVKDLTHVAGLRGMVSLSRSRSCPVSRTRTLTDAQNALYSCLPNHALRWLKVSEAAPAIKRIRVMLLEILEIVVLRKRRPGVCPGLPPNPTP